MAGTELGTQVQASTFTERGDEVMAEVMTLITDESQTSHEAELVREFYNDYIDMESRNTLGMEPVLPLLEEIRAIEDMDGLTAYICLLYTSNGGVLHAPVFPWCGIKTPKEAAADS